ncbi:MAG: efflux transporter outer membrane subunit [Verrucomicrobia bacterium]|nr:efflux transporter outer membrane subunit [Verrucomicrobiota bacterium]
MLRKKIQPLFICFLLLGGCARVPNSDLAKIAPPATVEIEEVLSHEFIQEGGWPTDAWWEMFDDPQLSALMARALEESPTLKKAQAKVEEANQEAKRVRSRLFPHMNGDYLEQWQYFSKNGFIRSFFPTLPTMPVPATVNDINLTLNFSYEFDFFGKNRNLFQAALGMMRAQRAESKQAILILTTLIAQTYIELQMRLQLARVLEDRLEQRKALYELTNARQENALDPSIPVLESEQNVYQVRQALITMQREIAIDRHLLNFLVGASPSEDLGLVAKGVFFERQVPLPTDLSSDLLARRPDLMAQIWRVEAAAKEIGAAKADFYPRINLVAFGGLESISFRNLFNFSSKQGALDPAIHLPIFTGGKLRANLRGKVAVFNEAVYRYNELLLHSAQEVADSLSTLTASYHNLQEQISHLQASERQLDLQFARYENGVSNFLHVLNTEENFLIQRFALIGYERDYLLSLIQLVKSLGGGYVASIPEVKP